MDHPDIRPKLVDMPGTMRQVPVKSRTTIYNLISDGLLVAVKVGGRRFITQDSIDHYIDQLTSAATKPDNYEAKEACEAAEDTAVAW